MPGQAPRLRSASGAAHLPSCATGSGGAGTVFPRAVLALPLCLNACSSASGASRVVKAALRVPPSARERSVVMAWLQRTRVAPGAAFRVACLPHAGSTAAFLPGLGRARRAVRGIRGALSGPCRPAAEPCGTDVCDLAAGVAALADRPVALFGHSMGVWAAFETALLLERGGVPPSHLFVSGASAPPPRSAPAGLETASPDELAAILVRLGGTNPALLDDPGLLGRYSRTSGRTCSWRVGKRRVRRTAPAVPSPACWVTRTR
ncbi:thioesterase II family protein [Streptomyces sp. NPDC088730]|uniref:thioesterase II family protein n=1 Tax=Streptomyces sp. NPDC088730 TaxID=3365877 RepID=UPI00382B562A